MTPRNRVKLPERLTCKGSFTNAHAQRVMCVYFLTAIGLCMNDACFYHTHPQSEADPADNQ